MIMNALYDPLLTCISYRRDRRVFCRHLLQRFVRECAQKDSYIGAPWLVKVSRRVYWGSRWIKANSIHHSLLLLNIMEST